MRPRYADVVTVCTHGNHDAACRFNAKINLTQTCKPQHAPNRTHVHHEMLELSHHWC